MNTFPTDYNSILQRLEHFNPVKYARTRNFIKGDVSYLSPYISRGVISLRQVAKHVLKHHTAIETEKFLQELAWREYWQRIWQSLGDGIFSDIKQMQNDVLHHQMVTAIENADTGIESIDKHIELLYKTGYLHNHLRMYVSSITCNIAKAHWLAPSRWMYYHLLDGDLASNSLSWQWCAGTFSSKKYFCNQENINRYTGSNQKASYLDREYEAFHSMPVPEILQQQSAFNPMVFLPATAAPAIDPALPILLYNAYNLDPLWHAGKSANRILLLEPSHYQQFPVSEKVLNFIIDLSKNIDGIQLMIGEFDDVKKLAVDNEIIFKTHPAFIHYSGVEEHYDELFPEVTGYHPSFFNYWKKCSKHLKSF